MHNLSTQNETLKAHKYLRQKFHLVLLDLLHILKISVLVCLIYLLYSEHGTLMLGF